MASEWYITDDDCLQCFNGDSFATGRYEFVQINSYPGHVDGKPFFQVSHGSIYLEDYSDQEVLEALNTYGYSDLEDFVLQINPEGEFVYDKDGRVNLMLSSGYDYDTAHRLIAEMFFEMENQEYAEEEFSSWNEAVSHVCSITVLDLYDFYEKTENDFVLLADKDAGEMLVTTAGELPKNSELSSENLYRVPSCIPEFAVHYFNKGLKDLSQSTDITSYSISSGAKAQLPSLLDPIIQADIGRDKHMFSIPAIQWKAEHKAYVEDLDSIFFQLGLLEVQRHRNSVTQGEASVHCNGKKIVQFGDEIKLKGECKDGLFTAAYTNKPLYGDIISGWGSIKPDSRFRQAALTQYGSDIVRSFSQENSLDSMIKKAMDHSSDALSPAGPENRTARDFGK